MTLGLALYADFCARTEAERKRMLEEKIELQEYQRKQQQIKEKEIEVRLNRFKINRLV